MRNMDLSKMPMNLPPPNDDGECDHLPGMEMPSIALPSTKRDFTDACKIRADFVILYFFPMMARSQKDIPAGWDSIPGARGCTPQNITISAHTEDLSRYDAVPIGVSTQTIQELSSISSIRQLTQEILSDKDLKLQQKLNNPILKVEDKVMYKRMTLVLKNSKIAKVFYPVFPPDKHVFEILEWLEKNA